MSLTYKPTITDGGIAHAISVNNDGVNFRITHVSFGGTKFNPTGKETSIVDERLKKELSSTARVDDHTFKIRCRARSKVPFYCQSIGFWSDDVLFAVYSSSELPPGGLFNIHNATDTVISYSLSLGKVGADKYEVILMADEDHLLELISEHENDPTAHGIFNKVDKAGDTMSGVLTMENATSDYLALLIKNRSGKTLKFGAAPDSNSVIGSITYTNTSGSFESTLWLPKKKGTLAIKEDLAPIKEDVNNKVDRSGDIMTGQLIVERENDSPYYGLIYKGKVNTKANLYVSTDKRVYLLSGNYSPSSINYKIRFPNQTGELALTADVDKKLDKERGVATSSIRVNSSSYSSLQLTSDRGNQGILLETGGVPGSHNFQVRNNTQGSFLNEQVSRFEFPNVEGSFHFLVKKEVSLPSWQDLNDVKVEGMYMQSSSRNATLEKNYPVETAGTLEVMYFGKAQRYTPVRNNAQFVRHMTSSTEWGPWQEYAFASNIPVKSNSTTSTSEDTVATSLAVKKANDNANNRVLKSGDTMTDNLEINRGRYSSIILGSSLNKNKFLIENVDNNESNTHCLNFILRKDGYNGENHTIISMPNKNGSILLDTNLSSSVESDNKLAPANSFAVKTAYNKAVQANENANSRLSFNGGTLRGNLSIAKSQYSNIDLINTRTNYHFLIETNPVANADSGVIGNFIFRNSDYKNVSVIGIPNKTGNIVLNSHFTGSISRNGWCRLPNGLIMQWLTFTSPCSSKRSWPIAFTQIFNVTASQVMNNGSSYTQNFDQDIFYTTTQVWGRYQKEVRVFAVGI